MKPIKDLVLLLDMTTLKANFDKESETASLELANGKVLTTIKVEKSLNEEEIIFLLLESALATTLISIEPNKWVPVALYNPFTLQVSFKPIPENSVYTANEMLALSPNGDLFRIEGDIITNDTYTLEKITLKYQDILAAFQNQI